jgi:Mg2+ and Co2+ transporter CorA
MVAIVVDAIGVRPTANAADIRGQKQAGKLFWLDIFGGNDKERTELLRALGLDNSDIAWALRFGQAGRMYVGRDKLRAVTWIADPVGKSHEIHVYACPHCILTVWRGEAAALEDIRKQFGERVDGLEDSRYAAAGILLQLLIGTVDNTIRSLDVALNELRVGLDKEPLQTDFALLAQHLQVLRSIMASFNRYSSAVRSAVVGIEAVSGMDERGASELKEYGEQVEDVEQQIYERSRWLSDIIHDNAAAVAQRQGEQINRLTLVSLIFLPVTALSGFFGMNFNWMIDRINSEAAFLVCGVLLPVLSVIISIVYFRRRGFIRFNFRPRQAPRRRFALHELVWPAPRSGPAGQGAASSEAGLSTAPLSMRKTGEAS